MSPLTLLFHGSGQLCSLSQGMVQLYYDKYIAKPLRLPTVRLDMAEPMVNQGLDGTCGG